MESAGKIVTGTEDADLKARLDAELTAFNRAATGASDEQELSVKVTDTEGELIGGLTGWTWGGCAGINMLWVHADHRRDGWGRQLIAAAEEEARRRGCTRIVVSSMTFQAPEFYRGLGYLETGRTQGLPAGAADVHFHKPL